MDNKLKYAIKLVLLNQLKGKGLLTNQEYTLIKNNISKKHKTKQFAAI